jgi:hypothetical protein
VSADEELRKLQERVAAGIVWLTEHDPLGVFHIWYEAGLTPVSHIPDEERRQAYAEYYPQRRLFDRLDAQLGRIDPVWAPAELGDPRLQPLPPRGKR